jgi:hypothetical protein
MKFMNCRVYLCICSKVAQESEQASTEVAEHQYKQKTPIPNAAPNLSNPLRAEDECE